MRSLKTLLIAAVAVAIGGSAYAELQNVEVGGSIRIRHNAFNFDDGVGVAIPGAGFVALDSAFTEQRTRLSVKADFTDEVTAFIELESYDIWGEDFVRTNYITGVDNRGDSADVEMYQAYIEANEMWGTPLRLRVGRQELSFGSEWLVGVNDASYGFWGLSFDAVRLDYATDMFSVTAFASKLAETFDEFGDNDTDFYGIYASYIGLEDFVIDGYWLFVRDDLAIAGVDEINHHTIGLRGAGTFGAFDLEAEMAYQFGEVERPDTGFLFWRRDNDGDIDAFGANLEMGYTFDATIQPRIFLGGAYFEGAEDDEDDLPFNRLFSNWEYTEFFANSDESNMWIIRGGLSLMPTESVELMLAAAYFNADETRERGILWWRRDADDHLGWEVGLYGDYHYSEDLVFRAGYAHFFTGDGIDEGNAVVGNGLGRLFGDDEDDFDYFFLESEIKF